MDQSIINSFKSHNRRHLVNKVAVGMASMAWKEVTPSAISNCFKKAGYIKEHVQQPQQESSQLTVDRNVWESLQEHLDITCSFDEYVPVDSKIPNTQNLTDDAIIQTVITARDTKNEEQSSDKEDKNDEPTKPLISSALCID